MHLEVLGEHTIDTDLLTKGGWCLDAGCRDFTVSRELANRGCRVLALDADPTVEDPHIPNVLFKNVALSVRPGALDFAMSSDPQARHLGKQDGVPTVTVSAFTIGEVMKKVLTDTFDAIKLDIEGAEYDILTSWPGPIARQISIEFHDHVQPRPEYVYDNIFYHLRQWYDVVQDAVERRHGCHPNRWDTLVVLR